MKEFCNESEIFADGVIEGNNYNCAIRVHITVYESLMILTWDELLTWLDRHRSKRAAIDDDG